MECQSVSWENKKKEMYENLFSGKNKKPIINLWSADFAQGVIMVNFKTTGSSKNQHHRFVFIMETILMYTSGWNIIH